MEPESTLAVPDTAAGTMHVYSGGQGVWDDRDQICAVLGVPTDRVTVELVSNGGAFGGKEDMSNQGQTALAASAADVSMRMMSARTCSVR
ncbi:MAG: molybdopterin cofactor-binding domain-containing protein [Actinomycetota bacterium]